MKQYEKSVTSQWGEDGVIEEIFNRIGTKNKIAVDLGAWNGEHFSNTWNLSKHGWERIMFEKDKNRIKESDLLSNDKMFCAEVKRIDDELSNPVNLHIPVDLDLLCIDIDGDDYYLWQDMVKYKPRVVVIEYNQTVPPWLDIKQERGGSFGASFQALWKLGDEKDYFLAHCTTTNMIFVNDPDWQNGESIDWSTMPNDWCQFIVTGYNGKQYRIGEPAHKDNQGGKHEKLITDVKYTEI